MICELCERVIIPNTESKHHLVPKSRGGASDNFVYLHEICHKQIHALFTEKQLDREYNTISKLKEHKDVQRFVAWVFKKPLEFNRKLRMRKKNR